MCARLDVPSGLLEMLSAVAAKIQGCARNALKIHVLSSHQVSLDIQLVFASSTDWLIVPRNRCPYHFTDVRTVAGVK